MELQIRPMTKEAAKEVCGWNYPGVYAVYNYPSWEETERSGKSLGSDSTREKEFFAVYDEKFLAAHFRLVETADFVSVGLGFCPDCCGKGMGKTLMELIKGCARKQYPGKTLQLFVRTFNERAIRCYEKAGFRKCRTLTVKTPTGDAEMYEMKWDQ